MGETVLLEKLENLEEKIDKLITKNTVTKQGLSPKEAAVYLGCSEWSVRELYYQKKLKTYRIGRDVYIPVKELDRYIEEGGVMQLSGGRSYDL